MHEYKYNYHISYAWKIIWKYIRKITCINFWNLLLFISKTRLIYIIHLWYVRIYIYCTEIFSISLSRFLVLKNSICNKWVQSYTWIYIIYIYNICTYILYVYINISYLIFSHLYIETQFATNGFNIKVYMQDIPSMRILHMYRVFQKKGYDSKWL